MAFHTRYVSRFLAAGCLTAMLGLTACSFNQPTAVTASKIQLTRDAYRQTIPTAAANDELLIALSENYRSYGYGPADIAVTYDPSSRVNTAMRATNNASRIASTLKAYKVPLSEVDILPIQDQGDTSLTLISYDQVNAQAPDNCYLMGGLDGNPTGLDNDYPIDCTIKTLMARQIANPKDLAGREGVAPSDGRTHTTTVGGYRSGEPLDPLSGIEIGQ